MTLLHNTAHYTHPAILTVVMTHKYSKEVKKYYAHNITPLPHVTLAWVLLITLTATLATRQRS